MLSLSSKRADADIPEGGGEGVQRCRLFPYITGEQGRGVFLAAMGEKVRARRVISWLKEGGLQNY